MQTMIRLAVGRVRHASTPASVRARARAALLLFVVTLLAAAPAGAQVELGLYWDTAYTTIHGQVDPVPGVQRGYVVLNNVSDPLGALGWEFCLDAAGRAQVVGVTYNGNAINLAEPPCFVVGLAAPAPNDGGRVLLASVDFLVPFTLPVLFTAGPTSTPSVPNQMSWIPASDPEALEPVATVEPGSVVGSLNRDNPDYSLSVDAIDFGERALGTTTIRYVTVTNTGLTSWSFDVDLGPGDDVFTLSSGGGVHVLAPGASHAVGVTFVPDAVGAFAGVITLGTGLQDVPLTGSGREGYSSYNISDTKSFGEVSLGLSREISLFFRNTGEVPLAVTPSLVGCGDAFAITAGGVPATVEPGAFHLINVAFSPDAEGPYECELAYGPEYGTTVLTGTGVELNLSYAVTGHLICGEIPYGGWVDRAITITNTGDIAFPVTPLLSGCSADITPTTPMTGLTLQPGGVRTIGIRYRPTLPDEVVCEMLLGDFVAPEPILGSVRETGLVVQVADSLLFGGVEVGLAHTLLLSVRNTDSVNYLLAPALLNCGADYAITSGGGTVAITPGETRFMNVRFTPTAEGLRVCALDLGAGLPSVALVGTGLPAVPHADVQPSSLVFQATAPGQTRLAQVRVTNVGAAPFTMTPLVTGVGFSLASATELPSLLPGQFDYVVVEFAPPEFGYFQGILALGEGLPSVALSGLGQEPVSSCDLSTIAVDFGAVEFGRTGTAVVTVINSGNVDLTVAPHASPSVFTVDTATRTIAPGATLPLTVTFRPTDEVTYMGSLELNTVSCATVSLTGSGFYPEPSDDQDEIGVFFDTAFLFNEISVAPFTVTKSYLVLRNASSFEGVLGWECRLDIIGNAIPLSWNLRGQALNIGSIPEFVVGIGDGPLPWARDIVLMDVDVLPLDPYPVDFFLGPTSVPSLPDQMAWVDGTGSGLRSMTTVTNQPHVATINGETQVGIVAPTPSARVVAGQIELSWSLGGATGDLCHVYRRGPEGEAERVTAAPLAAQGGSWLFRDAPTGFAAGTVLHYSYAVVRDGEELARSAETDVTVPGVVVTATRLLPNVPNPFNPETSIRFEMEKAGRARVAVYDITGREIAVLHDGHLDAGRWERTWQGRDRAGRPVASGTYYVRLQTAAGVDHRKIMLLK